MKSKFCRTCNCDYGNTFWRGNAGVDVARGATDGLVAFGERDSAEFLAVMEDKKRVVRIFSGVPFENARHVDFPGLYELTRRAEGA